MNDFCLFACSDAFDLSNGMEFIEVVQSLCNNLGIVLSAMDYYLSEDESDMGTHEMEMNAENLLHLRHVLESKPVDALILLSARTYPDDTGELYLNAEFQDTLLDGYKYVCIYFRMELVENWPTEKVFSLTKDLLASLNHMGRLDYALITIMESFLPQTYFREIFTANLTTDEALNLAMWARRYAERKTKLRGLYWGNLLSSTHLSQLENPNEFLALLDRFGCKSTQVNGDDLFFMFSSHDFSADTKTLVSLFLENSNLLMKPGSEDQDEVGRSVALNL